MFHLATGLVGWGTFWGSKWSSYAAPFVEGILSVSLESSGAILEYKVVHETQIVCMS